MAADQPGRPLIAAAPVADVAAVAGVPAAAAAPAVAGVPAPRRAPDGLVNFRDLGGIPVAGGGSIRPGVLYRSESATFLTEAGADLLRREYRLATVVDLRSDLEVERQGGRGPLAATPVGYCHLPITDVSDPGGRPAHYLAMLRERGAQIAAVVRLAGDPAKVPLLVHCAAGCDRTGVVVAVLLGLAGVAEPDICADYARTAEVWPAIVDKWVSRRAERGEVEPGYRERWLRWSPEAAAMAETLASLAADGGLPGWARSNGLTGDDITRLRAALVSPAPVSPAG